MLKSRDDRKDIYWPCRHHRFKNRVQREELFYDLAGVIKRHQSINKRDVLFVLNMVKKTFRDGKLIRKNNNGGGKR